MKKKLLRTILERINQYRDKAEYFLLMLDECNEEDTEFVDNLYNEVVNNIKQIDSEDQLQKISDELKTIKEIESVEDSKDKKDIEELENLIANIS